MRALYRRRCSDDKGHDILSVHLCRALGELSSLRFTFIPLAILRPALSGIADIKKRCGESS